MFPKKSPRENSERRQSRTADNFKFFFGGIQSKNSQSEYNQMIKHLRINKKRKPARGPKTWRASRGSAQSLLLFRSEADGAVVAVHHGHRHCTILHHETSEASPHLPRFPSGRVVGNAGMKSDASNAARRREPELARRNLARVGKERTSS